MMTCVYSIEVARLDLHLQQLRRAANAAQRVLDLVREVADQFLVGLRLVEQALFAVLPHLLLQRRHLDDQLAGLVALRSVTCTGISSWLTRRRKAS